MTVGAVGWGEGQGRATGGNEDNCRTTLIKKKERKKKKTEVEENK